MRKQAEQYKAEILRQLQKEQSQSKPSEVLEAEKVIANFRKEKLEKEQWLARAMLTLPSGDPCPSCFVKRGVTYHMSLVPSDTDVDLFNCKECGLVIEIKP